MSNRVVKKWEMSNKMVISPDGTIVISEGDRIFKLWNSEWIEWYFSERSDAFNFNAEEYFYESNIKSVDFWVY